MSENAPGKLGNLWLIGVLCAAPVIASYVAYYVARTDAHTNYGELLETRALPAVHLQLTDDTAFQLSRLKGKWVLLMVDAGGCDDFCQRKLFTLRQLRLSQGKDKKSKEITNDNIQTRYRRCHQAFHGALRAFPEEADSREQKAEE